MVPELCINCKLNNNEKDAFFPETKDRKRKFELINKQTISLSTLPLFIIHHKFPDSVMLVF